MNSVLRSLLLSSFTQYAAKILGFTSVVLFARLLTPEEIGIFAIASSISMLVTELRLLGTSDFLIRESGISQSKVSQAIGLSTLISWPLGIILISFAQTIESFYDIKGLAEIFYILSAGFFLAPFISTSTALYSRNMEYQNIMLTTLISQIITLLVSLVLILNDYSYISLAWGVTSGVITQFILISFLIPKKYKLKPTYIGLKPLWRFGLLSATTNLLVRFEITASDLIIGKLGSPREVALYSRAQGFIEFLSQTIIMGIRPVALPYLSKASREKKDMGTEYIKATLLLGAISWPVLAVAGSLGEPLIYLFFGEQWLKAAPLVPALAIWTILRQVHTLSNSLLVAQHREGLMLLKQSIIFTVTIACIYYSYPYGLQNIANNMIYVGIINFIISSLAACTAVNITNFFFVKKMLPNIALTSICLISVVIIKNHPYFYSSTPLIKLAIIAASLPIIWISSVKLLNHPILSVFMRITKTKPKKHLK